MLLEDKMEIIAKLRNESKGYGRPACYYSEVIKEEDPYCEKTLKGNLFSFGLRLTIAILLFITYFIMEERNLTIYELTSGTINTYLAKHFLIP